MTNNVFGKTFKPSELVAKSHQFGQDFASGEFTQLEALVDKWADYLVDARGAAASNDRTLYVYLFDDESAALVMLQRDFTTEKMLALEPANIGDVYTMLGGGFIPPDSEIGKFLR